VEEVQTDPRFVAMKPLMEWSELTSLGSGWLAFGLILAAGAIPVGYRLRDGRRAAPSSAPISLHVSLGIAVAAAAFVHALLGILSLGSSRAIGAGNAGLLAGAVALLVLMAHVGIGLQLRNPKLRKRPELRRKHLATALIISVCALTHVAMLWSAAP
jgi:hypothetical protein